MKINNLKLFLAWIGVFLFASHFCAFADMRGNSSTHTILVGSPIRQKPAILREFLESLERLEQTSYKLHYFFVDDNDNDDSKLLLKQFAKKHGSRCHIIPASKEPKENFVCDENTHVWKESLVWKVAGFKDTMIEQARKEKYDYLFLIDSDIVLHPKTIDQLILANKEIVSNIFWTCWTPGSHLLPQVWMVDSYTQYELSSGERISEEEANERFLSFLTKMRTPGTYEVGGLGACTLISKTALNKGIGFKKVKNLTLWGEDRHFCVRAVSLGIDLYVDTHYPAYHIYRESALADVENFKASFAKLSGSKPRITLSLIMRNEANRYLRRVLEDAKDYITDAVIIDDASTDNSVAVCREVLKGIPLKIVRNKKSQFANEIILRKQQWNETIKTNPDWIVFLDADEIFERKFHEEIQNLVSNPYVDAYRFRLFDFWNETHYREEKYWQGHRVNRIFLVRYRPDIPYVWNTETAQHCGRFPSTVEKLVSSVTSLRLKHYGWAKAEDRKAKYERYKALDSEAIGGIKQQYESILDPNPHLIAWMD